MLRDPGPETLPLIVHVLYDYMHRRGGFSGTYNSLSLLFHTNVRPRNDLLGNYAGIYVYVVFPLGTSEF
jgi:hypothetical protein